MRFGEHVDKCQGFFKTLKKSCNIMSRTHLGMCCFTTLEKAQYYYIIFFKARQKAEGFMGFGRLVFVASISP